MFGDPLACMSTAFLHRLERKGRGTCSNYMATSMRYLLPAAAPRYTRIAKVLLEARASFENARADGVGLRGSQQSEPWPRHQLWPLNRSSMNFHPEDCLSHKATYMTFESVVSAPGIDMQEIGRSDPCFLAHIASYQSQCKEGYDASNHACGRRFWLLPPLPVRSCVSTKRGSGLSSGLGSQTDLQEDSISSSEGGSMIFGTVR